MKGYTSYKLRLKPAILEEAQKSFAQYGIRAVKMDDIARNLGISKRTIYELYATKEDLLCEVVETRQEEYDRQTQLLQNICDNNMDLLIRVLGLQLESVANTNFNFFQDINRYPKVAKKINGYCERQHAYSAKFFAKGVEEGYFLPHVDYEVLNRIAAGTMNMLRSDDRYDDLSYKDLFLGYLYVIIRGFCTVTGLEKIDKFVEERFSQKE